MIYYEQLASPSVNDGRAYCECTPEHFMNVREAHMNLVSMVLLT